MLPDYFTFALLIFLCWYIESPHIIYIYIAVSFCFGNRISDIDFLLCSAIDCLQVYSVWQWYRSVRPARYRHNHMFQLLRQWTVRLDAAQRGTQHHQLLYSRVFLLYRLYRYCSLRFQLCKIITLLKYQFMQQNVL